MDNENVVHFYDGVIIQLLGKNEIMNRTVCQARDFGARIPKWDVYYTPPLRAHAKEAVETL